MSQHTSNTLSGGCGGFIMSSPSELVEQLLGRTPKITLDGIFAHTFPLAQAHVTTRDLGGRLLGLLAPDVAHRALKSIWLVLPS